MKNPKTSSKISLQGDGQNRPKLRLSAAAIADFEAIDAYSFEKFGADVADAYMRRFGELFDLLRRHPLAGQSVPDLGKDIRQLTHRRHRIFYRTDQNMILIVRIVHHSQDAHRLLGGSQHD